MGTTTVFLRHNDCARSLCEMNQEELAQLDELSPYAEKTSYAGWKAPVTVHNSNVSILIFWQGRLMTIDEAAHVLDKKYFDRYAGKERKKYEWTVLKRYMLAKIGWLDKQFQASIRKKKRQTKIKKIKQ